MIYSRQECKKIIEQLGIIGGSLDSQIRICKKKITSILMESILFHTSKCRDRLSERIYWILSDIEDYPFCKQCGKQFKPNFYGLKNAYPGGSFCSSKCSSLNDVTQEKNKQTCLNKYGHEYVLQSPEIKEKGKQTNLINLGVEYPSQSILSRGKTKLTWLKTLGYDNPAKSKKVQEKRRLTCQEKYGVDHVWSSPKVREQYELTCKKLYGVNNPMQNKDIFLKCRKSARKIKKFISPLGKIIKYQGYENIAYFKLLEDDYKEEQIITDTKLIPSFNYFFERERTYYPDIYIPHENKIIEVKSTYTYESDLERNLLKRQACLDEGYLFEFWICSNKEVIEIR
jgi:hypothetical protein